MNDAVIFKRVGDVHAECDRQYSVDLKYEEAGFWLSYFWHSGRATSLKVYSIIQLTLYNYELKFQIYHQGHHRGPINGGYDGFFIFLFKECWEILGFTIFCRKIINIYLES